MSSQICFNNLSLLLCVSLLRTNERGAHANQDHFVRSVLRTFPYAESQLLQQMVVQLAKTPVVTTYTRLGFNHTEQKRFFSLICIGDKCEHKIGFAMNPSRCDVAFTFATILKSSQGSITRSKCEDEIFL